MKEKSKCPICGKPTSAWYGNERKDKLCKEHAQQLKDRLIEFCENTQTWIKTNQNQQEYKTNTDNEITCIICGKPSSGKHFCKDCYYKYKNRSVDLRITNCIETQILDEYGNLQYKCADGRKVRSRAEMIINDFLFNNKIRAVYEETIFYKEDNQDKTLHPDFFLPDFNTYLEYNELTKKSYLKSKDYAQKIYNSLSKKVIIMTDKDLMDIASFLKPKLNLN